MKMLYSAALIANLLIEAVGAGVLLAMPDLIVDTSNASAVLWSWNYAFVALAIGSAVFWAWPHRESYGATGAVLGILASFHLAIAVALGIANTLFVDVVLHGVFTVLCLFLFTRRRLWCVV
ncbi:MAG: hypothetical protein ACE363_16155 [Alphaproteobacteria bacterium]